MGTGPFHLFQWFNRFTPFQSFAGFSHCGFDSPQLAA